MVDSQPSTATTSTGRNDSFGDMETDMDRRLEKLLWAYGLGHDQLNQVVVGDEVLRNHAIHQRIGLFRWCARLSNSTPFIVLCCLMILGNAVLMAFRANADAAISRGEIVSLGFFRVAESLFIVWYFFEILIRCLATVFIWRDKILLADIVIVTASAVDVWVLQPIMDHNPRKKVGLSFIIVFRALRLARLTKLLREVHILEPLYLMIQGMGRSIVNFIAIFALILILVLAFAMFITILTGPSSGIDQSKLPESIQPLFHSLGRSMVTILSTLLSGLDWGPNVLDPLMTNPDLVAAGIVYFIFICFAQFFLLNLITAIFIEQMFDTVRNNMEVMECEKILTSDLGVRQLRGVFKALDSNGDGNLSAQEFIKGLREHEEITSKLGLDLKTALVLFHELDVDHSDSVAIEEFLFGVMKKNAQSKTVDMLIIDHQQQKALKHLARLTKTNRHDSTKMRISIHRLADRTETIAKGLIPMQKNLCNRLRHALQFDNQTTGEANDESGVAQTGSMVTGQGEGASESSQKLAAGLMEMTMTSGARSNATPLEPSVVDMSLLNSWRQVLEDEGRPGISKAFKAAMKM